MILTGGCQCGFVRYECKSKPLLAYCCHCTDCQLQSASAFGMSVWFAADQFSLMAGTLSFWKTKGDSGNEKACAFCPECGSRLYHGFPTESTILSVKGGSLDDIRGISPIAHIWTRSAQPWMLDFLNKDECYETEPSCFDELQERYQNNTS